MTTDGEDGLSEEGENVGDSSTPDHIGLSPQAVHIAGVPMNDALSALFGDVSSHEKVSTERRGRSMSAKDRRRAKRQKRRVKGAKLL